MNRKFRRKTQNRYCCQSAAVGEKRTFSLGVERTVRSMCLYALMLNLSTSTFLIKIDRFIFFLLFFQIETLTKMTTTTSKKNELSTTHTHICLAFHPRTFDSSWWIIEKYPFNGLDCLVRLGEQKTKINAALSCCSSCRRQNRRQPITLSLSFSFFFLTHSHSCMRDDVFPLLYSRFTFSIRCVYLKYNQIVVTRTRMIDMNPSFAELWLFCLCLFFSHFTQVHSI